MKTFIVLSTAGVGSFRRLALRKAKSPQHLAQMLLRSPNAKAAKKLPSDGLRWQLVGLVTPDNLIKSGLAVKNGHVTVRPSQEWYFWIDRSRAGEKAKSKAKPAKK